jgi:lipopolysaccharide export system protein LptA
MKVVGLCFGVLVVALAANGQTVTAPAYLVTAREIVSWQNEKRVVAKGGVELTIGTTVITADEADIQYGGVGKVSDIRLTGPVRVKAILQ